MEINGKTYVVQNPSINPGPDVHALAGITAPASVRSCSMRARATCTICGRTRREYRQDRPGKSYDDMSDFFASLNAGSFPAVSYVKAPVYQYGHPGNSDPLVEQAFVVQTINAVMQSHIWTDTAIIIAWDDSDGWYDHVMPPVLTPSPSNLDCLFGPGNCGTPLPGAEPPAAALARASHCW